MTSIIALCISTVTFIEEAQSTDLIKASNTPTKLVLLLFDKGINEGTKRLSHTGIPWGGARINLKPRVGVLCSPDRSSLRSCIFHEVSSSRLLPVAGPLTTSVLSVGSVAHIIQKCF